MTDPTTPPTLREEIEAQRKSDSSNFYREGWNDAIDAVLALVDRRARVTPQQAPEREAIRAAFVAGWDARYSPQGRRAALSLFDAVTAYLKPLTQATAPSPEVVFCGCRLKAGVEDSDGGVSWPVLKLIGQVDDVAGHGRRYQCPACETEIKMNFASAQATAPPEGPSTAIGLVAAERQRQISAEGWTPEHDDTHLDGEMIEAARGYLSAAFLAERGRAWIGGPPPTWPWNQSWWKPSPDPVRNLVKAGALIAAEIDRLLRLEPAPSARPDAAPHTCMGGDPGSSLNGPCRACDLERGEPK